MAQLIPLTPAEIHVWLAFYDGIADERLHSAYRALLNAAERAQEPRFHFAADRRRYLVTRALVRIVMSRYACVDPREWIFSTNPHGRPEVVNPRARDAGMSFNISHTRGLIVLGVTRRRALGVDVEHVRAREVSIDIAAHYFAQPEVAALTAVAPQQRQYRFFEYWTLKEAYIKARGMGLSLPLDKFSFQLSDDGGVEMVIDPELADDAARWGFWQFRPVPEYLVAICAERVAAGSPRLIVRQTIPMISESDVAPEVLRVSGMAI
jgi:4'-phosphopantetheinyl transferase